MLFYRLGNNLTLTPEGIQLSFVVASCIQHWRQSPLHVLATIALAVRGPCVCPICWSQQAEGDRH